MAVIAALGAAALLYDLNCLWRGPYFSSRVVATFLLQLALWIAIASRVRGFYRIIYALCDGLAYEEFRQDCRGIRDFVSRRRKLCVHLACTASLLSRSLGEFSRQDCTRNSSRGDAAKAACRFHVIDVCWRSRRRSSECGDAIEPCDQRGQSSSM